MILHHTISSSYLKLTTVLLFIRFFINNRAHDSQSILFIYRPPTSLLPSAIYTESFQSCLSQSALISKSLVSKGNRGFTLVELLVTMTVLGIIATIAVPSILTHLARLESQRVKHQLKNTLSLARAESYISRQDVLVCLSNNGGRCHRDSDEVLLLFVDKNNNKHFDSDVDVLLTQQDLKLRYSTVKLRVGGRRHYTKFWGDSGKPRGHFGHIKYCPTASYNQAMYQISFNQAGIIKHKLNEDHPTKCGA
ncbi:GspH/FimT family pseudopilin [Psychrobacter sp. SWN149]|nr:GspH/FimT family pseudopilin [Psychrobacter sp. SWN149]MBH0005104.1 GspH/FimT family pseudopilin [Psychrobacter sp. SWN149]